jgi:hypothetical protein
VNKNMAAKQTLFAEDARHALERGVNTLEMPSK